MNVEATKLSKPEHLISLSSSGVLVSVDVKVWSATKQDRGISNEVTSAKRAAANAGKYVKNLLADHPKHKALVNYRQTIYNWMKATSYKWNNAQDYVPIVNLPKFKHEFNEHERVFNDLAKEFFNEYDSIVSDMAFKQGDMFDRNDYPDKESLVSKFGVKLFVSEVPMSDFRCSIAQEIADDLFRTYQKQTEEIVSNIMVEQQTKFADVLKSLSHCCASEEIMTDTGEVKIKKRKVYDTTINKAKELCRVFKDFNLTGSQDLEQARAMLEDTLNGVDAEAIRDSDAVRASVKDGVDDILSKFGAFQCV